MKLKYTQVGNVVLVGTSHIASESVKNVAAVIDHFALAGPCVVGVELDKQRFYSLVHEQKKTSSFSFENIRRFGFKGFIFAVIASTVTERLAKMVGAKPGDDMMSAIKAARKYDFLIALVDQPIHITLRRFSQTLTWKEKWHFIVDIFFGLFFPKREMKKYGLASFDLSKVPPETLIKKLLLGVEQRYPNIYRVLISERNVFMARKIRQFQEKYPDRVIIVVIGAGHEDGIKELLMKG